MSAFRPNVSRTAFGATAATSKLARIADLYSCSRKCQISPFFKKSQYAPDPLLGSAHTTCQSALLYVIVVSNDCSAAQSLNDGSHLYRKPVAVCTIVDPRKYSVGVPETVKRTAVASTRACEQASIDLRFGVFDHCAWHRCYARHNALPHLFFECDLAQESPCAVGSIDRTKKSGWHGE